MEQLRFRLEDFFPIYTMEDEKDFYNSVPIKKEFDDARAVLNEPRPQRGEQLKHQAFMMRFLSPHTPYDKMIAFHGLGSGKSCLLTSVSEYAKNIKSGEFGPYLQIVSGKKKQNISIPKSYDINKLNISHVLEIIASKNNQESNSKSIQSNYKSKKK